MSRLFSRALFAFPAAIALVIALGGASSLSAQTTVNLICEFSGAQAIFADWTNPPGTMSIEVSLDGALVATLGPSDTTFATDPLDDGYHELCVAAYGVDGLLSQDCCEAGFALPPGSPPEVTDLGSNQVALVWSSDPSVETREVCVDGVTVETLAWFIAYFVTGDLGPGVHEICIKGYDATGGLVSEQCVTIDLGGVATDPEFIRADCNDDGTDDIADAVLLLAFLFVPGADVPSCDDACDVTDDGSLDVADAVALLEKLFIGGGPIPTPYPQCGDDPTDDGLSCASYVSCP